jgi:hypothetical protein
VNARVKGSDKTAEDKKKEEDKRKGNDANTQETQTTTEGDELEEVAFALQPDGKVKKVLLNPALQDINYIEIVSGLKKVMK